MKWTLEVLPVAESESVPLYEGAELSVCASSVLVMKYMMKHNLTQEALGDLSLLRIHCPAPNQCPPSVYMFRKQFGQLRYLLMIRPKSNGVPTLAAAKT